MKKTLLSLLLLTLMSPVFAQPKKPKLPKFNKNKEKEVFLKKQWFLGIKAGINYSAADVIERHSVLQPTDYPAADVVKSYENFSDPGMQVTVEATFNFTEFSLSLQPTYRHNVFTYTNRFEWSDPENTANLLILNYQQKQQLDYFDLPIVGKYEKVINKFSPFLQGGIYYSFLLNANKSIEVSGIDYASGGVDEFRNETVIVGATDLFAKRHWGLLAGAGAYFTPGNVRLCLDVQYKIGMSNIASEKNRFSSDRLSGIGDTLDDIKLRSVSINLGCMFPLRFLSKNFRSTDIKK